jgi:hypothetical protein
MRRFLQVLLYLVAGLPVAFLTAAVTALTNHGGDPSWGWVLVCWLAWPIAFIYGAGFFVYANLQ